MINLINFYVYHMESNVQILHLTNQPTNHLSIRLSKIYSGHYGWH